ncbi:MAG: Aspartate aminotransferase (AspB-14), partial [uncultured Solirubrobacteraceae bacterium]
EDRGRSTRSRRRRRRRASPPDGRSRARALQRPLLPPHAGDAQLGDARPDGADRAARGHLAGRRSPGHLHLRARVARADPGRRGDRRLGPGAAVRAHGGPRRGPRGGGGGDGRRGHGRRSRRGPHHHRRPAGHRPGLQDADRSGRRDRGRGADLSRRRADLLRLPGRSGPDRHGQRRHAPRPARAGPRRPRRGGPRAEVHLHDPELPESRRRDHVAGAPPAPGRGRDRARAAGPRGQPVRPPALRGDAAAHAALARRRQLRHLPRHVLEDPLAGHAPGLVRRAGAGAREDEPRQAGRRPLLVVAEPEVRGPVLPRRRLARLRRVPDRRLSRSPRRDARRAGRALPRRGDLDPAGGRALRLGDHAVLHRHHRPAGPGAAGERRLRAGARGLSRRARRLGDAPQLLGRGGPGDPRGDPAHRQGGARAARALRHDHRRRSGGRRPAEPGAAGAGRRSGGRACGTPAPSPRGRAL